MDPLPHHYVRRKHKRLPPSLVTLTPEALSPHSEQCSIENINRDNIEQSPQLMEVVTKEKRDHVGRAHSTAFTPSVEHDRLNIFKTQPTATYEEDASFEVTSSHGIPRCQETTGEDSAHARHETTSKSKEPSHVGTPHVEGEDRLTYNELMAHCTTLNLEEET